jgi:hypothetical protein
VFGRPHAEAGARHCTGRTTATAHEEGSLALDGLAPLLLPGQEGRHLPADLLGEDDLALAFALRRLGTQRDEGLHPLAVPKIVHVEGNQLGHPESGRDGEEQYDMISKIAFSAAGGGKEGVHLGIREGLRHRLRGVHRGLGEQRKAQLVPDVRLRMPRSKTP